MSQAQTPPEPAAPAAGAGTAAATASSSASASSSAAAPSDLEVLAQRLTARYGPASTPLPQYPRHRDHLAVHVEMTLAQVRAVQELLAATPAKSGTGSTSAGSATAPASASAS